MMKLQASTSSSITYPNHLKKSCRLLRAGAGRSEGKTAPDAVTQDERPVRAKDLGVGLKAAWYGAEVFGDLLARMQAPAAGADTSAGSSSSTPAAAHTASDAPSGATSVAAVLDSIRADYAQDYFISGQGEMANYDPQCLFADPFVSFRGVERFKKNVSNLGALISDVDLQITQWEVSDNTLEAHWRLAAAGSTTHIIDLQRGLVVEHVERWKSEPGEVVARLLKPAAKVPSNSWETFMLSLSEGDLKGCWFVVSGSAVLLSAPVLVAAALTHLFTGHNLPGAVGGSAIEVLALALLVAGLTTEVLKFAGGMQGGETGTGGRF